MAVEIIHDRARQVAAMWCNTTDTAFGPVFTGPTAYDDCEEFIEWLRARGTQFLAPRRFRDETRDGSDPRDWTEAGIVWVVNRWRNESGVIV